MYLSYIGLGFHIIITGFFCLGGQYQQNMGIGDTPPPWCLKNFKDPISNALHQGTLGQEDERSRIERKLLERILSGDLGDDVSRSWVM